MYTINLISTNHFINYINKSYNTFYLEWKLYMRQVLYLVMLFKFKAKDFAVVMKLNRGTR